VTLRAAFMGSPEFAVPSLESVARACELVVVVTQPDRPAGRGRHPRAPAVKTAAAALGVRVIQPTKMKDGTLVAELGALGLDVAIVVAFGRILPPDLLAVPAHGCINVHASLLPRWRGAAPIQRAILAGDTVTGVSIMAMDAGLDTGPVHRRAEMAIDPRETAGELSVRLAGLGARELERFLAGFPGDAPVPQPEDGVTHAPPLAKEEGRVDWARPSRSVIDHVRGMDPWPTAWTVRADAALKLFGAAESTRAAPAPPGTVLAVDAAGLHVATGDGAVVVAEVQAAGGRRMGALAYAGGHPFDAAERLQVHAPTPSV
jgi:methionyl-tRNA formyltransferase